MIVRITREQRNSWYRGRIGELLEVFPEIKNEGGVTCYVSDERRNTK